MIDLYFYFLKQNSVAIQVTVDNNSNMQYTIDCIKLGGDGFKSNSYARVNSKFLEDGLKQVLETFDMLDAFNNRYVKVMDTKNKENDIASGITIQMTQSVEGKFNHIS